MQREFRWVNKRVLENAPCSVGILIDRRFGGGAHVAASNVSSVVTVPFFGGVDDCEALSYGIRMSEHPGISLTVVRFKVSSEFAEGNFRININDEFYKSTAATDTEYIAAFKENNLDNSSINYEERSVKNTKETVEAIREFGRCNLFIVGRNPEGPVIGSLNSLNIECPELGPVGNLLISQLQHQHW